MGQAVRIVGVVSSIPSRGNSIFTDFETHRCQFCTEMSDLRYLGKTHWFTLGKLNCFRNSGFSR